MYGRGDTVICINVKGIDKFHYRPKLNQKLTVYRINNGGRVQLEEYYGLWFGMNRFATEDDIIRMKYEEQMIERRNKILKIKSNYNG